MKAVIEFENGKRMAVNLDVASQKVLARILNEERRWLTLDRQIVNTAYIVRIECGGDE